MQQASDQQWQKDMCVLTQQKQVMIKSAMGTGQRVWMDSSSCMRDELQTLKGVQLHPLAWPFQAPGQVGSSMHHHSFSPVHQSVSSSAACLSRIICRRRVCRAWGG